MDTFRFILENPHPNATTNKQRKRARLVTACDSCRIKKIKCQQSVPTAPCEACKTAKSPCLFGDRDRYQAERGVTCTWNPPPLEDPPAPTEGTSRKRKISSPETTPRKRKIISDNPADHWKSLDSPQSTQDAASANGFISNYHYSQAESQSGPSSLRTDFELIPQTIVPSHGASSVSPYPPMPLFDPSRPRCPHPQLMRHLGAIFFDNIGSHFPFLDRHDVLHRIEQQTCAPILANIIASLAARFPETDHLDLAASATFYEMAKSLAVHVTSVPSVEALHALICITWAEYGTGSDSGFWSYSRMAIAMCLDLGLGNEATIQLASLPEVRLRLRFTWWTVVCMADISCSWATGNPTVLDLDSFDTALPQVTDDNSLMFRNIFELLTLCGQLKRFADGNSEKQNDSALQWDLLQSDVQTVSKGLTPSLRFSRENLTRMHEQQLGHFFIDMHFLIHAVGASASLPSLLRSYALPPNVDAAQTEVARSSAKAIVEVLMVAEEITPRALRDPFLDLPLLVASRVFRAESTAQPGTLMAMSTQSDMLARQWSDTFLAKCKDGLVRISSGSGGAASFDGILERHGGTLVHDPFSGRDASADIFTVPQNAPWLLRPGLIDDTASDTSSSFRSSSRELSPRIVPASRAPSSLGTSPLVRPTEVHEIHADMSFQSPEIFKTDVLEHEGPLFDMNFLGDPYAMPFLLDNPPHQTLLPPGGSLAKAARERPDLASPNSLCSPLQWLTRASG